jgi:peptidoglycan hydrolase-like protein with peptidoglycan-binding domain
LTGYGGVAASGSHIFYPSSATTYKVTCTGGTGGTAVGQVTVTISNNSNVSSTFSQARSSFSANVLDAFDVPTRITQVYGNTASNSSSCGEFTMTLVKGMVNEEVKCLQKMLLQKGFGISGVTLGEETTYFGYNTQMAVKAFQASNGLVADGIFGASSMAVLKN